MFNRDWSSDVCSSDLEPTKRGFEAFLRAYDKGILIRTTGDIIAMSPPLIISRPEIDQLIGTLAEVLQTLP